MSAPKGVGDVCGCIRRVFAYGVRLWLFIIRKDAS
jgi:hypothetical protein